MASAFGCWEREIEGRSASGRAGYTHVTPHQRAEPMTDGKAQAGTAILSRRRLVRLGEAFENTGLVLFADTDARVFDLETERVVAVAAQPDMNAPLLSKLDGIPDQV